MASMNVMDARRYVKVGQLAAAALGLVAAGLWAAPNVPGLGRTLPSKPELKADPSAQAPADKTPVAKLDKEEAARVADLFEAIASVKKPVAAPPVVPEEVRPVEPPPPAWTYLGPIQEPSRLLALISVEGHQKVIAEGRKYGDLRLVSVLPDGIVVEDATGKHNIPLAERGETFSSVAWVKTMPANTPPAAPGANGAAVAGQMSPEVAARLRERGINPDDATQRWRAQMRDRMNRGRDAGGAPGSGTPGGRNGGAGAAAAVPMANGDVVKVDIGGTIITTNSDGQVTRTDGATTGEPQRTRRVRPRGEIN